MGVSIITPWLNHSELCRTYAPSVKGAEVIVVDNGSEWYHAERIERMVDFLGGKYIRNEKNEGFSKANNQGLKAATCDIVVFLNNDVECPSGWLLSVEKDITPGVIGGPSVLVKHGIPYVEGFCMAARRDVWNELGGWPEDLPGLYWEDNILCLRAKRAGYKLVKTTWNIWHFNNYTSRNTLDAYAHSAANEQTFLKELANET